MKKRICAALLAATLALGLLTGCGGDKGAEAGTPAPIPTQSAKPSTKLDKPPQPEQKEDIVYCCLTAQDRFRRGKYQLKLPVSVDDLVGEYLPPV